MPPETPRVLQSCFWVSEGDFTEPTADTTTWAHNWTEWDGGDSDASASKFGQNISRRFLDCLYHKSLFQHYQTRIKFSTLYVASSDTADGKVDLRRFTYPSPSVNPG